MKLYITIDNKTKTELYGSIYNKPRKNKKQVYLRYNAERLSPTTFSLDIYNINKNNIISVILDETYDCSMTAKDILYWVENRIQHIIKL